jgi:hypothetical protein
MFVVHETLPNKRKLKKLCNFHIYKLLLFDIVMGFKKKKYYYAFIVQKCIEHTFFE